MRALLQIASHTPQSPVPTDGAFLLTETKKTAQRFAVCRWAVIVVVAYLAAV